MDVVRKIGILYALLLSALGWGYAQSGPEHGKVSYVTSRSVYVAFPTTEGIEVGDTIYKADEGALVPFLVVDQKSSSSCVTHAILEERPVKGDLLVHQTSRVAAPLDEVPEDLAAEKNDTLRYEERIRGRVSVGSYSTMANQRDDNHRMMYRLSVNADHIKNSKFSAETYVAYRQLMLTPERASGRKTNFLNIYNLAVRYDATPTLSLAFGRKINNKISSLGPIDGLQAEKHIGHFYSGAVVGFRPDFVNQGFNPNLLQYGAYVGWQAEKEKLYSTTTLGLLQQTNSGAIDRRYLYFQHSSTINWNLHLFASAELDVYNQLDGEQTADARLTNLYVSGRYRFSRKLSLTVSYDSRRRVLFYESFRTDAQRMLLDDEAMQGIRARLYYRPFKYTSVGVSYSKRFQNSNRNASDNYNLYISRSKVPFIGGRMGLTLNRNESVYLVNQALSLRHSRDLIRRKLGLDLYLRAVDFTYTPTEAIAGSNANNLQFYYGGSLNYRIKRTWTASLLGELSMRDTEQTYRINARIIKRFDSKQRK